MTNGKGIVPDLHTPAPSEPNPGAQPSSPTPAYGVPHIGTDIPAWDDTRHAAWRAFGSDR